MKVASSFAWEKGNRFFLAVANICRREMRPQNTITFCSEVDLSAVERLRERAALKPSYTAFVVKAMALALKEFPFANRRVFPSFWGRRSVRFQASDIAVAIERDVPDAPMMAYLEVIRDADQLSLSEITEVLRAFSTANVETSSQWAAFFEGIQRFPSGLVNLILWFHCALPKQWVRFRGGACIVSSPAKYGVDQVAGVWSHPLGVSFGKVRWASRVVDGQCVARKVFTFTLNWDRRLMAGAQAGRFFKRITDLIENAPAMELSSPNESHETRVEAPFHSKVLPLFPQ